METNGRHTKFSPGAKKPARKIVQFEGIGWWKSVVRIERWPLALRLVSHLFARVQQGGTPNPNPHSDILLTLRQFKHQT